MKNVLVLGKILLVTTTLISLVSSSSGAQVLNNEIADRSTLWLDSPYLHSSTDESTVQWDCVNNRLTRKCLIYHNDQWFTFKVNKPGKYFLNFKGQQCRDNRGIQVVLIEGNPCETQSYLIRRCIDKLPLDDGFVTLDSMKADVSYLVNVDGFLGDFCTFEIQLGHFPIGLPLFELDAAAIEVATETADSVVHLTLNVPFADKWKQLILYRREEKDLKYSKITQTKIRRNSVGKADHRYDFYDTLSVAGSYSYSILAANDEEVVRVTTEHVRYLGEVQTSFANKTYKLPVSISGSCQTTKLRLYNAVNGSLLHETEVENRNLPTQYLYPVSSLVRMGIRFFRVVNYCDDGAKVGRATFAITEEGEIIQR